MSCFYYAARSVGLRCSGKHFVARRKRCYSRTYGLHCARNIQPEEGREADRNKVPKGTGADLEIKRIDTRCSYPYQDLTCAWNWVWIVFVLQYLRAAIAMDHDCFHK